MHINTLRHWIDNLEVRNLKVAQFLCQLIPASCPFSRDIPLFGKTLHIPPLCKLNPLYDQLMGLRWRALILISESGESNLSH